jgi:tripartite-type tricarboxylate transporter receptor subunit TctC
VSELNKRRRLLLACGAGGVASSLYTPALTYAAAPSDWPNGKSIRLIVPAQPGGGLDLIARLLSDKLTQALGVSWVAENLGGAGGTIACITTARAVPDGQTFMIVNISTHGTNPAIRNLPYDPLKDFSHIGMVGGSPNVLVTGPNFSKANNLEALLLELKKLGKPITYGSAGPGTSSHLLVEQLSVATGIPFIHVPYRGIGPALMDVIAGRTDIAFPAMIAAMQLIKSNRLKPIAITAPVRLPQFPNLPTFSELGMPEFSSLQWYGLSGPAKMPKDIVDKLNTSLNKILRDPVVVAKLDSECLTVMPMSPDQFTAFIAKDIDKWNKLVKTRGIQVEG